MSLTPDHFVSAHQSLADDSLALGRIALDGAEQLIALNLSAARSLLGERHEVLKSLIGAKNAQEIAALGSESLRPEGRNLVAYASTAYGILARTQEEWLQQVERQQAGWNRSVARLLDAFPAASPGASDVAVAALRSAVSAANSTFDSVNKAARQVADITGASVAAATSAPLRAVAPASSGSRRKAA